VILQFLAPSSMGVVLLVWLIFADASSFGGTTSTFHLDDSGAIAAETSYVFHFGRPEVLRLQTSGPTQEVQHVTSAAVFWDKLLLLAAAAWLVAMPIARWISGYRDTTDEFIGPRRVRWRSPAAVLLYVILASLTAAAMFTVIIYFMEPGEAGLLQARWPLILFLWIPWSYWTMKAAVPLTLLVMLVRRWRFRRNVARRGFQVLSTTLSTGETTAGKSS
jgi:hypothetical protein